VDQDPEKMREMLALTGGRQQVPVIVDGDKVAIGFVGEVSLRGGIPLFGGT
jgi:glutaredoxin